MSAYACRAFRMEDILPWDYIQSGVSIEFLMRENKRAMAAQTTKNCRVECWQCGMECKDGRLAFTRKTCSCFIFICKYWYYFDFSNATKTP